MTPLDEKGTFQRKPPWRRCGGKTSSAAASRPSESLAPEDVDRPDRKGPGFTGAKKGTRGAAEFSGDARGSPPTQTGDAPSVDSDGRRLVAVGVCQARSLFWSSRWSSALRRRSDASSSTTGLDASRRGFSAERASGDAKGGDLKGDFAGGGTGGVGDRAPCGSGRRAPARRPVSDSWRIASFSSRSRWISPSMCDFISSAARAISSTVPASAVFAGSLLRSSDCFWTISTGTSLSSTSSMGPTRSDDAFWTSFFVTVSSGSAGSMGRGAPRRRS